LVILLNFTRALIIFKTYARTHIAEDRDWRDWHNSYCAWLLLLDL